MPSKCIYGPDCATCTLQKETHRIPHQTVNLGRLTRRQRIVGRLALLWWTHDDDIKVGLTYVAAFALGVFVGYALVGR